MTWHALIVVRTMEAPYAFAISRWQINGHGNDTATGILRTPQQSFRNGPITRRIELKPNRGPQCRDDVFDGRRRQRRQYLVMTSGAGGPCHRQLRVGMKSALARNRRQHDRRGKFTAKNFGRRIEPGEIDEAFGSELNVLERSPVLPQRPLIVHAHVEIGPMRRHEVAFGDGFEVEHVHRFVG